MYVKAQKRGLLDSLHENLSTGRVTEYFNDELKEVMENLRNNVDAPARSLFVGQQLENASVDFPVGQRSLKDILASAKSNYKTREYMAAVAEIGRFHKVMLAIVNIFKNFTIDMDKVHHGFLFKDMDPSHREYLLEHLPSQVTAFSHYTMVKNAGVMSGIFDFFSGLGKSQRHKALARWEKLYPRKFREFKNSVQNLISRAETLFNRTKSALKSMNAFRSSRDIDKYVETYEKQIVASFKPFDDSFQENYKKFVKPLVELEAKLSPKATSTDTSTENSIEPSSGGETPAAGSEAPSSASSSSEAPASEPLDNSDNAPNPEVVTSPAVIVKNDMPSLKETMAPPPNDATTSTTNTATETSSLSAPVPAAPLGQKSRLLKNKSKPISRPPSAKSRAVNELENPVIPQPPKVPNIESPAPEAKKTIVPPANTALDITGKPKALKPPPPKKDTDQADDGFYTSSHAQFMKSLESMANESPFILSRYIAKYASLIQKSDPKTASKLLKIAKSIIE